MESPLSPAAEALSRATPEELQWLEKQLAGEIGLRSPADWASICDPNFLEPLHVRYMSDCMVQLTEGKLLKPDGTPYKRLLVTMPPRHGKSEMLSRYSPAWYLCKYPKNRVILTSYESDYAREWGVKVRELIEEHGDTFDVKLNPNTKAGNDWRTSTYGGMKTAGAGGPITGKGAHLFIIDDPIKNSEEAQSELIREKIWNWYQSTVFTRLEPGGVIVLVQTRWHEDDLAGRVLRDQESEWFHITFPAVAEDHDVLGRAPGEALWPERYGKEDFEVIKETVGAYVWNSLYQQHPYIEGGGILKPNSFRRFSLRDGVYCTGNGAKYVSRDKCWRFLAIDTAGTTKTYSDYSVCGVFDVTPDREALLIDLVRVKVDSDQHLTWLRELAARYDPRFIGIENRSFGTTLIQTALRAGLRVQPLKADADKVTRAYGITPFQETGRMQLPYAAPFLAALEHEMSAFPYGTNDDQVDVLAYAARVMQDHTRYDPKPKGPQLSREEITFRKFMKNQKAKRQHSILGSW